MSNVDPVAEFIDIIKQDIPEVETVDELLAVAKVIVYVIEGPQSTP